jgi:hypothetical protein
MSRSSISEDEDKVPSFIKEFQDKRRKKAGGGEPLSIQLWCSVGLILSGVGGGLEPEWKKQLLKKTSERKILCTALCVGCLLIEIVLIDDTSADGVA